MVSGSTDGHDQDAGRTAEAGNDEEHPHVKTAGKLSDRAAETVSRRYDGTKEAYDHAPEHVEDDERD
jgi:hypothetical protein